MWKIIINFECLNNLNKLKNKNENSKIKNRIFRYFDIRNFEIFLFYYYYIIIMFVIQKYFNLFCCWIKIDDLPARMNGNCRRIDVTQDRGTDITTTQIGLQSSRTEWKVGRSSEKRAYGVVCEQNGVARARSRTYCSNNCYI